MKKTVVIGATNDSNRYAYKAAHMLHEHGHEFVPVGIRKGNVLGKEILNIRDVPKLKDVDTITLYINPMRQKPWYDYILSLLPKRIIFNPGTENPEFQKLANEQGIETEYACSLVMLSTGQF